MTHQRRALVAVMPALLLVSLSGCSLLSSATTTPVTGVPACVPGHTWTTDLKDLDGQLKKYLTTHGYPTATVVSTGTQTLNWPDSDNVTVATDYTTVVSVTNADATITKLSEVHQGASSGTIYLNGSIAVPRNWVASSFTVKATADVNGVASKTVPFTLPNTVLNDEVALDLTCNSTTMTMLGHSAVMTIKWDRAK